MEKGYLNGEKEGCSVLELAPFVPVGHSGSESLASVLDLGEAWLFCWRCCGNGLDRPPRGQPQRKFVGHLSGSQTQVETIRVKTTALQRADDTCQPASTPPLDCRFTPSRSETTDVQVSSIPRSRRFSPSLRTKELLVAWRRKRFVTDSQKGPPLYIVIGGCGVTLRGTGQQHVHHIRGTLNSDDEEFSLRYGLLSAGAVTKNTVSARKLSGEVEHNEGRQSSC